MTSSVVERYFSILNNTYSVHNIISIFTARMLKYNQEIRFNKFEKSSLKIRIMVVTISLRIDINISDIERIFN